MTPEARTPDTAGTNVPDAARSVDTAGRLTRVPNQPKTPVRGFRIPDDLYKAAQAKAKERNEDLSAVVRAALLRYVRRTDRRKHQ